MRIVAYQTSVQEGKVLLRESTGESVLSTDLDKLFSFLLEDYGECLKVCWDLDQTVALFLRLLGRSACRSLQKAKKWRNPPWAVFYIPSKVWSLSYGRHKANLYHLSQYYPSLEEPSLDEVKVLGDGLLLELRKMGFWPVRKLTSPVAIYEESVLSKLDLPKLKDIPKGAAQFAYRCSARLWIEAHVLGAFLGDKG